MQGLACRRKEKLKVSFQHLEEGKETGPKSSKAAEPPERQASGRDGFALKHKACEAEERCCPNMVTTEHQVLRAHVCGRHSPSGSQKLGQGREQSDALVLGG